MKQSTKQTNVNANLADRRSYQPEHVGDAELVATGAFPSEALRDHLSWMALGLANLQEATAWLGMTAGDKGREPHETVRAEIASLRRHCDLLLRLSCEIAHVESFVPAVERADVEGPTSADEAH